MPESHNRHRWNHGRRRKTEPILILFCSICDKPADCVAQIGELKVAYCETCALTYDDGLLDA